MVRPSNLRLAQVSIGVRLLVIIRSLGEYFRLQYLHRDALAVGQITPYFAGALFAAAAERLPPGASASSATVAVRGNLIA
jgi:hypothetical protein